jgi:hypothetical protein
LTAIRIPKAVKELCKDWERMSALETVVFESANSLRAMIEAGIADLNRNFGIAIVECDCELDFAGYSVDDSRAVDGFVHLVA